MIIKDFLTGLGVIGVLLLICLIIFLPLFITVIVGVALANILGFSGLVWWCFIILFYIVITAIIGKGA